MGDYTTRRRGRRFSGKTPQRYVPKIWIEGPSMYVTCSALPTFTAKQELEFFKLVHKVLYKEWGINTSNLTIERESIMERYRIDFNDPDEFIMVKLLL